jgi:anti-anti-sigma regulatory factor
MARPYRIIAVDRTGDVCCVRLKQPQITEPEVHELAEELIGLIDEEGCRKMVLSLGPGSPNLIYSVFVAKLLTVRRRIQEAGGALKLCNASPAVEGVFDVLRLTQYFDFYSDQAAAVAAFGS